MRRDLYIVRQARGDQRTAGGFAVQLRAVQSGREPGTFLPMACSSLEQAPSRV